MDNPSQAIDDQLTKKNDGNVDNDGNHEKAIDDQLAKKNPTHKTSNKHRFYWVVLILRLLALCATILATVVMSLNKESKTMVVATIGTTPIKATLKAKFQHTPAFVFFVVVNAIGSFHNLLMLMIDLFGYKYDFKGLKLLIMTLSDMTTVVLVSGAVGAAASMAELGKNGNSHARWNKTCDQFETYCNRGGIALVASFIGVILLLALNVFSTIAIHKKTRAQSVVIP